MKSSCAILIFCLSSGILATSNPATGHYIGKKPADSWISTVSAHENSDIQTAECSHNTRINDQKFAWFKIDPAKINQNNSTYGTCYATTEVPTDKDLEENSSFDVFFWQNSGGEAGVGTGPIRDPITGEPGYEDDSGAFHKGNPPNDTRNSCGSGNGQTDTSSNGHATGIISSGDDAKTTSGGKNADTITGGNNANTTSGGNNTKTTCGGNNTNTSSGGQPGRITSGHRNLHTQLKKCEKHHKGNDSDCNHATYKRKRSFLGL